MIEFVTHCYSAPPVPHYHKLLAMQINSLFSMKVSDYTVGKRLSIPVRLTICYTKEDILTSAVVDSAAGFAQERIQINPLPLSKPELFRRAIGRNKAALASEADVVWFTDCDHLFNYGAVRSAYEQGKEIKESDDRWMIHPQMVQIHRNHRLGDKLLETAFDYLWGQFKIPLEQFAPRRERKAIGGLQIVPGWLCRKEGYLDDTKWVEPTDSPHFLSCKGDVPFRRIQCKGSYAKPISGCFRVRHSYAGRDQGEKDHGA